MDAESATAAVAAAPLPVVVAEIKDDAPPTLAEPASGQAADLSAAPSFTEAIPDPAPSTGMSLSPSRPLLKLIDATAAHTNPNEAADTTSAAVESTPAAPATAPEANNEDTTMKDAADDAAGGPSTAPGDDAGDANGTPATKKAAANANGRRKSGGVPEHKNKKLNKKKSMPKITHLDAQPGEFYFARLKSYPPWPSIICDEEMLPDILLSTRPITTKKADGTYNEAYADGGKKVNERTFPVMFLYTNELYVMLLGQR
jgi:hypothetical protein